MKFVVVSTGFAPPTRERCIASVRSQVGVDVEHIVIDAAEQHPSKGPMENLVEAVSKLPDDAVVCRLDLDDWLASPTALLTVQRMYREKNALCTYGSLRMADGRSCPWFRPYEPGENVRTAPWNATHLRTWYAHLFKRIKREDLMLNGRWIEHARDCAEAFPIIEQVGHARAIHCPDILVVYNFANSTEHNASAEVLIAEKRCVEYVRSLPPYAMLEEP